MSQYLNRQPRRAPIFGLAILLAALLSWAPSADAQRVRRKKPTTTRVKPKKPPAGRVARSSTPLKSSLKDNSQAAILKSATTGAVGRFRKLAKADPFLSQQIKDVLKDRSRLIDTPGTSKAERKGREAYVPYASNRPMRKVLVRTIMKEMNSRSARLKTILKAEGKKGNSEKFFDTVFVGAGVHTAIATNALSQAQPGHKMLVIEAGKYVSANFFGLGQGLAINSSSRAENNKGVQPFGKGNNNPTTGPVQVPDISGSKYPAADSLSDVAAINLHSSGADIMTQSRVTKVEARAVNGVIAKGRTSWPAKYKVTTKDGVVVFANNLVVGSGLGKPNIRLTKGSQAYIKSQTSKIDYKNPNLTPSVLFYEQAMALANVSRTPRDPYRSTKAGERAPTVMVVGAGDSGRTFLELLFGQAPAGAYDGAGKLDRAQRGDLGNIKWVVGTKGPKDCSKFLNSTRARYLQLTGEVRSNKAELVADGIKSVGAIKTGKNKGRTLVTFTSGKKTIVDKVVFATGFKSEVADFLKPVLPKNYDKSVPFNASNAVEKVFTTEVKGTTKKTPVAQQIKSESIYLVGPAAGTNLVRKDQIRSTNENTAAIKFLGPATAGLSKGVLAKYKPQTTVKVETGSGVKTLTLKTGQRFDTSAANEVRTAIRVGKGKGSLKIKVSRTRGKDALLSPERTGLESFVLKLEVANVLDGFTFPGRQKVEFTVSPTSRRGIQLEMKGVTPKSLSAIRSRIQNNTDLTRQLAQLSSAGKSLTVSAEVGSNGAIKVESVSMSY